MQYKFIFLPMLHILLMHDITLPASQNKVQSAQPITIAQAAQLTSWVASDTNQANICKTAPLPATSVSRKFLTNEELCDIARQKGTENRQQKNFVPARIITEKIMRENSNRIDIHNLTEEIFREIDNAYVESYLKDLLNKA